MKQVIALVINLFLFFLLSTAQAETLYNRVIIVNNAGQQLTNFQVRVEINTAQLIAEGKLLSSCHNIRFFDTDGISSLPYFRTGACNTANTSYWLKIPDIPQNGSKQISVVYGFSNASDGSNPEAIYDFYDSFSGTGLDPEKWTVAVNDNLYYTVVSDKLSISIRATPGKQIQIMSNFHYDRPLVVEQKTWLFSDGSHIGRVGHAVYTRYGRMKASSDSANIGVWLPAGWVENHSEYIAATDKNQACYDGKCTGFFDTDPIISTDAHILSIAAYQKYTSSFGASLHVDWVRARKHAVLEPTSSVGPESVYAVGAWDDDWDQIADLWEIQYGLDPANTLDAWSDPDGDGIFNRDEFFQQTIPVPMPVNWMDTVGLTVDGSTLTKTAVSVWGNSGAISAQHFFGDGTFNFTVNTKTTWAAGLSHTNASASYDTISYSLFGTSSPNLYVYENGKLITLTGTYSPGDQFSISRVNGVVHYKKNGVLIHTSDKTFAGTLRADVALYAKAASIIGSTLSHSTSDSDGDGMANEWERLYGFNPHSDLDGVLDADGDGLSNTGEYQNGSEPYRGDGDWDQMPDTWEVQYSLNPADAADAWQDPDADGVVNRDEYLYATIPTPLEVTWRDTVGVNIEGGTISKTAASGWGNSGAASQEVLYGDGSLSFVAPLQTRAWAVGLSTANASASNDSIAIYLESDEQRNLFIKQQDTVLASVGKYLEGDDFAIKRESNSLSFEHNGHVIYTFPIPVIGVLIADVAFYSVDAQLSRVFLIGHANDRDGDGMANGWERQYGLNPNDSADGRQDSDGDGLSNLDEYLAGTMPYSDDSDWDQMPDAWELQYGLHPVYYADAWEDPDGDGVYNRDEFLNGTIPVP